MSYNFKKNPFKSKKRKFNNIPTMVNGKRCDSKLEAKHYLVIVDLEKKGKVKDIKLHPRYPIFINEIKICDVVLDFEFFDCELSKTRYVDSKGVYTSNSKKQHKMFSAYYGYEVEIWTKDFLPNIGNYIQSYPKY